MIDRRSLMLAGGSGLLVAAVPLRDNWVDVRKFGAKGDGRTIDTPARFGGDESALLPVFAGPPRHPATGAPRRSGGAERSTSRRAATPASRSG